MEIISEIAVQKKPAKTISFNSGVKNHFTFYTQVSELQIFI
jgi:hypothetical protein